MSNLFKILETLIVVILFSVMPISVMPIYALTNVEYCQTQGYCSGSCSHACYDPDDPSYTPGQVPGNFGDCFCDAIACVCKYSPEFQGVGLTEDGCSDTPENDELWCYHTSACGGNVLLNCLSQCTPTGCALLVEDCGDDVDNDGDGLIDCQDYVAPDFDCPPPGCPTCQEPVCYDFAPLGIVKDWGCFTDWDLVGVPNACDDGNWCSLVDTCVVDDGGSCGESTWRDCSGPCAGDPCMSCSCNEAIDSCQSTTITACINGDGCCAAGCTPANDTDCGAVPSIGFIKARTATGATIKLNVISAANAITASRGVVKVAMTAGDTGSAADLVLTTAADASPVRVRTPIGTFAWRLIP